MSCHPTKTLGATWTTTLLTMMLLLLLTKAAQEQDIHKTQRHNVGRFLLLLCLASSTPFLDLTGAPKPPSQTHPVTPVSPGKWVCPSCTFQNAMASLNCEVCNFSPVEESPPGVPPRSSSSVPLRPQRQTSIMAALSMAPQRVLGQKAKSTRPEPPTVLAAASNHPPSGANGNVGETSTRRRQRSFSETDFEDQVKAWDTILKRQKVSEGQLLCFLLLLSLLLEL